MKKKILVLLLSMCFAIVGSACTKETEQPKTERKETEAVVADAKPEVEEKEETEEKKVSGAVFGSDEEDFEGFEYLYAETLMTESAQNEESGKMESQKVTALIPISDYPSVSRDYAYSDKFGLEFNISLNPYMQYEQEDYLAKENLEVFLTEEYDEYYSVDYKDMVISEVTEVDKNRATATVSYVEYDKYDDVYDPVYVTYNYVELDKNLTALVEVKIRLSQVTGKLQDLINEIEAFYEFDVEFDQAAAQKKLEDFLASGGADGNAQSTGYLMFDLPKGWEADYEYDYSLDAYAPGGDAEFSECVVTVDREYMTDSFDTATLLEDEEYTKAFFTELIGESISDIELKDMGATAIGQTVKVKFDVTEEGTLFHYSFYFATTNDYLYTIYSVYTDGASENAEEVAEGILATGKIKE